jgi:hypothetical protein
MTTIERWCDISELSGRTTMSGKPRGSGPRGVDGGRSLLFPSPRSAGEPTGRSEDEGRNSPRRFAGRARTRLGVLAHRRGRRCAITIPYAAADVFVNKPHVRVMLIMLRARRAHSALRVREFPAKSLTASNRRSSSLSIKGNGRYAAGRTARRITTPLYSLSQSRITPQCHMTKITSLDLPSLE